MSLHWHGLVRAKHQLSPPMPRLVEHPLLRMRRPNCPPRLYSRLHLEPLLGPERFEHHVQWLGAFFGWLGPECYRVGDTLFVPAGLKRSLAEGLEARVNAELERALHAPLLTGAKP